MENIIESIQGAVGRNETSPHKIVKILYIYFMLQKALFPFGPLLFVLNVYKFLIAMIK